VISAPQHVNGTGGCPRVVSVPQRAPGLLFIRGVARTPSRRDRREHRGGPKPQIPPRSRAEPVSPCHPQATAD
jgi:hypothetical protein